MRNTVKTIEFENYFRVPNKGQYDEVRTITVCEPNFDKRAVYHKMSIYVSEASKGLSKWATERLAATAKAASATAIAEPPPSDDAVQPDALFVMRMGLSIETYPVFVDWVCKELTNTRVLAYAGDDAENKIPITDEVWMNLAAANGMDAIDQVVSAFASFFLDRDQAKSVTKNGTEAPSLSPSHPKAPSRSPKR
jgi:hypothetical protein